MSIALRRKESTVSFSDGLNECRLNERTIFLRAR